MTEAELLLLQSQLHTSFCDGCRVPLCDLERRLKGDLHIQHSERGMRLSAENPRQVIVMLAGLVGLCTFLEDGRRQIIRLCGPGDVLMPCGHVDGMDCWVEVLAPSRVCSLELQSGQGVDGTEGRESKFWHFMERQFAEITLHIVTLGRLDGMERVCLFLTDMTWRFGVEGSAGRMVQLPLSREDIADYLGLNSETVSRILSRIKKAKLVTFVSRNDYVVSDIKRLQGRSPIRSAFEPQAVGATSAEGRV